MTSASWPLEPGPPERPATPDYPYPPLRPTPRREGPLMVPIVDLPETSSRGKAPRRVLLSGPLDGDAAMRVSAELMELDGRSGDDVELVVSSDGGRLGDVVGLLDVIGSMRARVPTLCMGRAMGTAAALVACGTGRRRAGTHAVISLRCSQPERIEGTPTTLRAQLEDLEHVRRHVITALTHATGQPTDELAHQLDDGPLLTPAQAVALGILDPDDEPEHSS